ncbi:MAG TPA: hypothetical protein VJ921_09715 [Vicinamibacteria bacterium]|nr:hypothetical protein [Vicinamibacteria bacterium]
MRHFALEDWVDLARESIPVEQRTAMLRHAADCSRCVRTLRVWRRVAAIGRSEASFVPPEEAVRAVKSAYLRHLHQLSPAPESLLARLVFDSFRAPAAAGVRTLDLCSRQLLFEADDLAIDLRIETAGGSLRSSLMGQLLHHSRQTENLGELPVALMLGKHSVAHTTTNPFGEFLFELELNRRHRIRIQLDAIRSIVVPLGCLDDFASAP